MTEIKHITADDIFAAMARIGCTTLTTGRHRLGDRACNIMEAYSQAIGMDWTDDSERLRTFDFWNFSDTPHWQSDQQRTEHLVRLLAAMQGSMDWPHARQQAWCERVIVQTVNQIASELPGLPSHIVEKCRYVKTLDVARNAAQDIFEFYPPLYCSGHAVDPTLAARRAASGIVDARNLVPDNIYEAANCIAFSAVKIAEYTAGNSGIARVPAHELLVTAVDIWCGAAEETNNEGRETDG